MSGIPVWDGVLANPSRENVTDETNAGGGQKGNIVAAFFPRNAHKRASTARQMSRNE
jgi:hypothetical protein